MDRVGTEHTEAADHQINQVIDLKDTPLSGAGSLSYDVIYDSASEDSPNRGVLPPSYNNQQHLSTISSNEPGPEFETHEDQTGNRATQSSTPFSFVTSPIDSFPPATITNFLPNNSDRQLNLPASSSTSTEFASQSVATFRYDEIEHSGLSTVCSGETFPEEPTPPPLVKPYEAPHTGTSSTIGCDEMAPPNQTAFSFLFSWWWIEVGAAAFSLLCMLSILLVLLIKDDTLMEDWSFGIQPNTLLNIVTTLARSALIIPAAECIGQLKWSHFRNSLKGHKLRDLETFDSATRSPFGAVMLLVKLKVKRGTYLACWGGLIMISALAVGPFTQQALQTGEKMVVSSSEVALTNTTSTAGTIPKGLVFDTIPTGKETFFQMPNAFMMGLYSSKQSDATIRVDCPSGNCIFNTFSTLGVCSSCADVTEATKKTKKCGSRRPTRVEEEAHRDLETGLYNFCDYSSPGSFQFHTNPEDSLAWSTVLQVSVHEDQLRRVMRFWDEGVQQNRSRKIDEMNEDAIIETLGFLQDTGPLDNQVITNSESKSLNGSEKYLKSTGSWDWIPNRKFYECSLRYCIKTFHSLEQNGTRVSYKKLTQTPLKRVPDDGILGYSDKVTRKFNYTYESKRRELYYLHDPTGVIPGNYTVENQFSLSTQDLGVRLLQTSTLSMSRTYLNMIGNTVSMRLYFANLTDMYERIAAEMTESLRNAEDASEVVEGMVLRSKVYIKFAPLWLVFPFTVVLLSSGFLAALIVKCRSLSLLQTGDVKSEKNRARGEPLWKNSSILPLFSKLEGYDVDGLVLENSEKAGLVAEGMRVRLGNGMGNENSRRFERVWGVDDEREGVACWRRMWQWCGRRWPWRAS